MDNAITFSGNLTSDPQLRFGSTGKAYTTFSVAVNRRIKDGGEWKDATPQFWNVKCFGNMAENLAESVGKGHRVIVFGTVQREEWDKNGETQHRVVVVADDVGPSVLFKTATVNSTTRTKTTNNPPPPAPTYQDEEPFQ